MLIEKKITAYYFAGEDGFRRIQTRAIQLGLTEGSLWLHCGLENPIIRTEYLDYIDRWLKNNPNCKVLFLDTMEKVIIPKQKREYGDWVQIYSLGMSWLKIKMFRLLWFTIQTKVKTKGLKYPWKHRYCCQL